MLEHEDKLKLVKLIVDKQLQSAKVKLTIGGTDDAGQVLHDVISIQDAPPAVMEAIRNAGYHFDVTGGLCCVIKI